MGKSLSTTLATVLSVALGVAALVDQTATHSLIDHADAMYAPHGKDPSAGLLYGVLYTISVVGLVLWLLALRAHRAGSRWAAVVTVLDAVLVAALALVLLTSREYGEQIWPARWGVLALLSPLAGVVSLAGARRTTAGPTVRTS